MTTAASTVDIDNTVTSPRCMVHPSNTGRSCRHPPLASTHQPPTATLAAETIASERVGRIVERQGNRPVNDIDRWFERTARREDRTVSLYACLLTGRIFAYFRYRIRFALLLDATSFVVHVAEFLIILTTLGGLAAFTVMILRVGSLLVSGVWWGLLEIMRERLRAFAQAGERDAVEREIGCWLVLSVVAASAVTLAGGLVLALWLPPAHDSIGRFYAFLVVVELALRMPVRVLHSGMYATRRIYRPLWTLFAPTVAQLLVIGVGVFIYPAAAIVVAIIVSNAIGIWITVHYTVA